MKKMLNFFNILLTRLVSNLNNEQLYFFMFSLLFVLFISSLVFSLENSFLIIILFSLYYVFVLTSYYLGIQMYIGTLILSFNFIIRMPTDKIDVNSFLHFCQTLILPFILFSVYQAVTQLLPTSRLSTAFSAIKIIEGHWHKEFLFIDKIRKGNLIRMFTCISVGFQKDSFIFLNPIFLEIYQIIVFDLISWLIVFSIINVIIAFKCNPTSGVASKVAVSAITLSLVVAYAFLGYQQIATTSISGTGTVPQSAFLRYVVVDPVQLNELGCKAVNAHEVRLANRSNDLLGFGNVVKKPGSLYIDPVATSAKIEAALALKKTKSSSF